MKQLVKNRWESILNVILKRLPFLYSSRSKNDKEIGGKILDNYPRRPWSSCLSSSTKIVCTEKRYSVKLSNHHKIGSLSPPSTFRHRFNDQRKNKTTHQIIGNWHGENSRRNQLKTSSWSRGYEIGTPAWWTNVKETNRTIVPYRATKISRKTQKHLFFPLIAKLVCFSCVFCVRLKCRKKYKEKEWLELKTSSSYTNTRTTETQTIFRIKRKLDEHYTYSRIKRSRFNLWEFANESPSHVRTVCKLAKYEKKASFFTCS